MKLVIKAASQKYEDFIIEKFDLDWSIKYLKDYLGTNYPKNPDSQLIRLIYSGKLLHDHLLLKEIIRQNSDVTTHIIHLVHSHQKLTQPAPVDYNKPINTIMDDELTPGSSSSSSSFFSSSSSSSSTSSSSTPSPMTSNMSSQVQETLSNGNTSSTNNPRQIEQIQSQLNSIYEQQLKNNQKTSPKEQYDKTLANMIKYYDSIGFQVQLNPWYSAYIQHTALYHTMYTNYLDSMNATLIHPASSAPINETLQSSKPTIVPTASTAPQTEPEPVPAPAQAAPVPPPPQPQPARQNQVNNNDLGEREDDWLAILHNIVSFLILFSIIYYYSSFERFMIIFVIGLLLILYHNGWLTLQRRQVNRENNPNRNANANQPAEAGAERNDQAQNENPLEPNERDEQTTGQPQLAPQPNILRFVFTFVLTFFTSLIPDRPRAVN